MRRGKFITFEGGEGCGKSTQIQRIKTRLEQAGIRVVVTREPGGTHLAERIRDMLKHEHEDPPCDRSEVLLFLAARAQLVHHVIRPALEKGVWVLSDRFSDSTFAYQGYGRGLPLDMLRLMNHFACESLTPDRTFLLDVLPAVSRARLRVREEETQTTSDRIEAAGDEFHLRLREGFRAMAVEEPDRIFTIEASGTPEEVEEKIWKQLKPFI